MNVVAVAKKMKKATAKGGKAKAGKKEPPKKQPKLTKAQLRAIEEARLAVQRNRNKMLADATVRQTRKLQSISVDDLRQWFNLRRRPNNPLGPEDDTIYIDSLSANQNNFNSLLNPLVTYTISQVDRSESPNAAGQTRQGSLDITPWGGGEAKG